MMRNVWTLCVAVGAACALVACGGGTQGREAPEGAPSATAAESTAPAGQGAGVCALLSREQVDTVIPGNDGGQEQDTSEAALLHDVQMQRCRYLKVEGTTLSYLDLLVSKASSDDAFEQIAIGEWAHRGSSRRLDIGDLAFLDDRTLQGQMAVTVSTGRTILDLTLTSADASEKSEQLIELARSVVGKLEAA